MTTRTRMNVYFDPELLARVGALSLRRQVSKSAIIEAAVASFLSGDSVDKLEAAMSRRLDRLGRQIDTLHEDLAILGETVSLFVHIWLASTPPLPESAQAAARAKGAERFEGFMQTLGRRLATGDRFLKELSRDMPAQSTQDVPAGESAADDSLKNPSR
ncbi:MULTISPECIES: CopG family transcriptional regulator [unclassified Nitrobacter]|uniref:ribbon-helix-helix domain-containing protein n=1 Tax=unclassified Nitrobacter TaxID=2620411 RepID=UPI000929906A|nr:MULTISPECIES: CopG family transcriptional regulator [unclassified Nitrobacter]MBN9149436.1 CopG family transcriptional regulator [Nitrobacter sp.]OJV01954.1 MAG: CopG family transcriptional regulator [Nitrobacter sp. 62-23]